MPPSDNGQERKKMIVARSWTDCRLIQLEGLESGPRELSYWAETMTESFLLYRPVLVRVESRA
jgi:hypothetical protein